MKRALLAACLALASAAGAMAQGAAQIPGKAQLPQGAYLLPPNFKPGNLVELRLALPSGHSGGKRELKLPSQAEQYEITRIVLEPGKKGDSLSVFFIPWKPGSITIRSFQTEGITVPEVGIYAQSSLEGDSARVRPLRGLVFLRGTKTLAALILSSVAAAVLAAWACLAFAFPFLRRLWSRNRARRPYKRFLHDMRVLRRRLGDGDEAYFYFLLSRAFRAYASARIFPAFSSLTSGEISGNREGLAPDGDIGLGEEREALAGVLTRSDMVRFARAPSDRLTRDADSGEIARIVEKLEAHYAGV
jgi:hypothetical protein